MADAELIRTDKTSEVFEYLMRLPSGRQMYIELPAEFVTKDRDGGILLRPAAVRHLDEIRALAARDFVSLSPAHLITLRQALDLTQEEFGHEVGVDKMTVSRWERGTRKPGAESLKKIKLLRGRLAKKGVLLHA